MSRVTITIPDGLLERLDAVATEDYTSRSDVIRQALLFYIRFTGATLSKTDAEELVKNMKNRQLGAYLNKVTKSRRKKPF